MIKTKTNMNKIYLFLIALFLASGIPAQYAKGQENYYKRGFIYMKNGSVLKGTYIYSPTLDKIRINSGSNSWVFNADEVDHITTARPRPERKPDTLLRYAPFIQPKWFNISEIGMLVGNPNDSQAAPAIFGSAVYRQAYKNLFAGAGLGVEFFKESYLPATLNLLYKFRNTGFTPVASVQAGYEVPVGKSRQLYYEVIPDYITSSSNFYRGPWPSSQSKLTARGGMLVNPSLGFIRQWNSGLGIIFSAGYRFHRLHYSGENDYHMFIDYSRLSVKLGFIIN
jgi:hypothetical protein